MKTISLKSIAKGEIELKISSIGIDDRSGRMNHNLFHFLPMLFLILCSYYLYDVIGTERILEFILKFVFSVGFLLITAHLYFPNLKRTNKRELQISEIKNVRLRRLFGELYMILNWQTIPPEESII